MIILKTLFQSFTSVDWSVLYIWENENSNQIYPSRRKILISSRNSKANRLESVHHVQSSMNILLDNVVIDHMSNTSLQYHVFVHLNSHRILPWIFFVHIRLPKQTFAVRGDQRIILQNEQSNRFISGCLSRERENEYLMIHFNILLQTNLFLLCLNTNLFD